MTIEDAVESIQLFRAAIDYMRSADMRIPTVLLLAEWKAEQILTPELCGYRAHTSFAIREVLR